MLRSALSPVVASSNMRPLCRRSSLCYSKHRWNGNGPRSSSSKRTWSNRSAERKISADELSSFAKISTWYSNKLDTHPILTKCITSGLISAAGDWICQYLTFHHGTKEKSNKLVEPTSNNSLLFRFENWDVARTGQFATLGFLWVGPVLHFWYGALFQRCSKHVILRVSLDQFIFAPAFVTSFLSWLWWWEGETVSNLPTKLKENVPSIVVANWALWIPAQSINFYLMPVKYHVLFSNFVALIWNAYLSYSSHD